MLDLLLKRSRPTQVHNVEVHHRYTAENDKIIILKNPANHQYFQLDEQSYFVWQLLDGNHTLRDINIKLIRQFKIFCPPMVEHVVRGLVKNEFVTIDKAKIKPLQKMPWKFRILFGLRSVLEAKISIKHTDTLFTTLYKYFGKYYYSALGQVIIFSVLFIGFIAFWLNAGVAIHTLVAAKNPGFYILFLIPANFIALAFHEMGHGLATKHVGRAVGGAGFGWYWVTPIAFVNTTDMWLATRKERTFVNFAGIQNDAFIAGIAMLLGLLINHPVITACLWLFACLSYFNIFKNLNPFLEFDGYFVLMDIFDKPRLRQRATLWLVEVFPKGIGLRKTYHEHAFAVYYWFCSILFIIASIIMTRLLQVEVLHPIFPNMVAGEHNLFMSWFLPFIVVFISFLTIYFEAKHLRKDTPL
jgi:putative peptide zinc metalloprotease protein